MHIKLNMNRKFAIVLQNMCRTCMRQFSETENASNKMRSIFEEPTKSRKTNIMQLLQMVYPEIKLEIEDNLPTLICSDCVKKLLITYNFIEMYKNSDRNLRIIMEEANLSDSESEMRHLTEESLHKDDIYGINKYALEIEELNFKVMGNIHHSKNDCPELQEMSKCVETYFTNPYSDGSDDEWMHNMNRRKKTYKRTAPIKGNEDYDETSDGTISNCDNEITNCDDYNEIQIYDNKKITTIKISNKIKEQKEYTILKKRKESVEKNEHTLSKNIKNTMEQNELPVDYENVEIMENNEIPVENKNVETVENNELPVECENVETVENNELPVECENVETVENNELPVQYENVEKNELRVSKNKKHTVEQDELPVENENGNISCKECKIVLEDVELWQEHMRNHRLERKRKSKNRYVCEHCGKGFAKCSDYKIHLRIHTGEQPYLCFECGKAFKVISSFKIHMLRHKGVKNYQCKQCPKKFVCSSGLSNHMMVHTKERPFVCDICGSAFHMSIHLRKHKLYHDGIKNFPCDFCDKRFILAEKQRRHMRTHTGEKPYRCKYCEKAFSQSNDYMKHLRLHLGNNVYQCELCPQRFPLARDLQTHFATHKDDDDETRARNLEARLEEQRNLEIKLGLKVN